MYIWGKSQNKLKPFKGWRFEDSKMPSRRLRNVVAHIHKVEKHNCRLVCERYSSWLWIIVLLMLNKKKSRACLLHKASILQFIALLCTFLLSPASDPGGPASPSPLHNPLMLRHWAYKLNRTVFRLSWVDIEFCCPVAADTFCPAACTYLPHLSHKLSCWLKTKFCTIPKSRFLKNLWNHVHISP